ncbi:MAG: hypothetical protein HFH68_05695 [Lachnospiraceae bacterium]|nr:hypothetical protein [Lachnospiraceae bacterium]
MRLRFRIVLNCDTLMKFLIYFQIIYVCIIRLLIIAGMPGTMTLVCDFVNILLLFMSIGKFKGLKKAIKGNISFYYVYLIFFLLGIISAFVNGLNIIRLLWSVRNFGRFIVFMTACCITFELNDVKKLKRLILCIGHINFLFCCYQYFVKHLKGDYIGGVFGTEGGVSNTWLNVLLVVLFVLALSEWLYGRKNKYRLFLVMIETMGIAVISELKFFFIEIILICMCAFIIAKKTYSIVYKSLIIVVVVMFAMVISVPLLYRLFPGFRGFFNLNSIIKNATSSYTASGDLGRASAVYEIATKFFDSSAEKVLFGLGLGNGEFSSTIRILQSDFYLKYSIFHYHWFTDAYVMVQNGIIGVGLYLMTHISIFLNGHKALKANMAEREILLTGVLVSFSAMLLYIYNISLNTESAYLLYCIFPWIYICKKDKYEKIHEIATHKRN